MYHNETELIQANLIRLKDLREAFKLDEFDSYRSIYYQFPQLNPSWLTCCFELGVIKREGKHKSYSYTFNNIKLDLKLAKEICLLYYDKQLKLRNGKKVNR
jgi:hypothetical protein